MTARLAIVADHDPTSPAHAEIDRVLPLLPAGVSAQWVAPERLASLDGAGIDGLWFVTRGPGEVPTDGERAAYEVGHRWAAHETPVLTHDATTLAPGTLTGAVPDPGLLAFVHAARTRAVARQRIEERRAFAAEENRPRDYVHQMRGPRYRWWRPLATIILTLLIWMLLFGVISAGFALVGAMPESEDFALGVGTNLWMNLMLASLIPAALIATRLGQWRPMGRLMSVTGRVRWGWLLQSMALVTPLWVVYLGINWFVFDQEVLPRPQDWIGLLVVTAITTPLQAAGEEVAFRGVFVQAIGAWIANRWVALGVSTAVTTALFVAAHGSMDVWIWLDLAALAVLGCWLTWRTGGLEAAMALHIVNNLTVTFSGILLGGLEESYVSESTTGSPVAALMSWVVMGLATALLLWVAKRKGLAPAGHTEPALG
jgi:membrane protease YdiL (CAAX protease family)